MAPLAAVLRAALAGRAGAIETVTARLGDALDGFVANEMTMHAMAVRWRLGAHVGGDAGRALRDLAAEWARSNAIGDLEALSRLLVPV
jgi:hypothetical protein